LPSAKRSEQISPAQGSLLDDPLDTDPGRAAIDNNQLENQVRPWALGRSNWLFAGLLRLHAKAGETDASVRCASVSLCRVFTGRLPNSSLLGTS